MKKIFTLLLVAMSTLGFSQTDVYLKLNHKLDGNLFSYYTLTANGLEDSYEFDLLQYYISQVTLTYDGGQDTLLPDSYYMVAADQPFNEYLGSFNFTNLESITFGIGVDASKNHADPSTYPTGHALGFHNPSMHWGWAAGYRFALLEGTFGNNQNWELHALGDKNYGYTTIATNGQMMGADLVIALDANYEGILDNIEVSTALTYHGEDQQTPIALANFRTKVFTAGDATFGVADLEVKPTFSLAPNPTTGRFEIILDAQENENYTVSVVDITGKVVAHKQIQQTQKCTVEIADAGIYMVSLLKNGQVVHTQKLVVK